MLRCYYNFVRPHGALKFGREIRTPAMQAGLTTRRLTFGDIFLATTIPLWSRIGVFLLTGARNPVSSASWIRSTCKSRSTGRGYRRLGPSVSMRSPSARDITIASLSATWSGRVPSGWAVRVAKKPTSILFFKALGGKKSARIKLAAMDMWKPFRNSVIHNAPNARIIFDKFHIMRHLSKALDEVRRGEYKRLVLPPSSVATRLRAVVQESRVFRAAGLTSDPWAGG